jgi:hypothetical protein
MVSTVNSYFFLDVRPANSDKIFITLIVDIPIIPIFAMVFGFLNLLMELPYSPLRSMSIFRSFAVRIVFLLIQAILAILFYQACTITHHPRSGYSCMFFLSLGN